MFTLFGLCVIILAAVLMGVGLRITKQTEKGVPKVFEGLG